MSDWEERMSLKAKARAAERARLEEEEQDHLERLWHEKNDATVDEYVEALAHDCIKEGYTEYHAVPCACSGSPRELHHLWEGAPDGYPPCGCALMSMACNRAKEILKETNG